MSNLPNTYRLSRCRFLQRASVSGADLTVLKSEALSTGTVLPSIERNTQQIIPVDTTISSRPHQQERIFYPYTPETAVAQNGGNDWDPFPLKTGNNRDISDSSMVWIFPRIQCHIGQPWSQVIAVSSGIFTKHNVAIEEARR